MDCSLPGSPVHGILQARILEWVAVPFSRVSSWPRDGTWVSYIVGRFLTIWATREETIRVILNSGLMIFWCICLCLVTQSCLTLCDPMDCSPPGLSIHGDSPAKNTGVVYTMPSSRSSQLRYWTQVFCIAGGFFTLELIGKPLHPLSFSEYILKSVSTIELTPLWDSEVSDNKGSVLSCSNLGGVGGDSWESLGLQGDPTSQS